MNQKKIGQIMKVLIIIAEGAILLGALFQLQHYPHGKEIFFGGIWCFFILSSYEIRRLRNIIAKSDTFNNKGVSTN